MRDDVQAVRSLIEAAEHRLQDTDVEQAANLAAQAAEAATQGGHIDCQVQALLLLHQIRRALGAEHHAGLLALHALRLAREAGLTDLVEQAQQALLSFYALPLAIWSVDRMVNDLQRAG